MPIFVYRCDCGHRFDRLVPRDAEPPGCPQCGGPTRKIPAGPRLARGAPATGGSTVRRGQRGPVPVPWQGVVRGGPETVRREIAFRQGLEAKSREGLRTLDGPDRPVTGTRGTAGEATPPPP